MDIRWIDRNGVMSVPLSQIRDLIARDDGIVWAHLDHDDDFGMSVLIITVAPRPEDLKEVQSRTPVPRLHMYPDHHFSAINGLVRGADGLLHLQPLKVFLTPRVLWTVFGPTTAELTPRQEGPGRHAKLPGIVHERVLMDPGRKAVGFSGRRIDLDDHCLDLMSPKSPHEGGKLVVLDDPDLQIDTGPANRAGVESPSCGESW